MQLLSRWLAVVLNYTHLFLSFNYLLHLLEFLFNILIKITQLQTINPDELKCNHNIHMKHTIHDKSTKQDMFIRYNANSGVIMQTS